jgi:hypothetical protein
MVAMDFMSGAGESVCCFVAWVKSMGKTKPIGMACTIRKEQTQVGAHALLSREMNK